MWKMSDEEGVAPRALSLGVFIEITIIPRAVSEHQDKDGRDGEQVAHVQTFQIQGVHNLVLTQSREREE